MTIMKLFQKRFHVTYAYLTILTFVSAQRFYGSARNITLGNDSPTIITVKPSDIVLIYPSTPSIAAFIVCQAHAQQSHVTLSSKPLIEHSTSKYGRDVGMVSMVTEPIQWYLFSNSTTEARILVHLSYYSGDDPLPGGCNEEFNLLIDPNIQLQLTDTKAIVDFQWSNTDWIPRGSGSYPSCDKTIYWPNLLYNGYVNYIQGGDLREETYFDHISQMLTAEKVQKYGKKIKSLTNNKVDKSNLVVSSYNQRGVVYTVVVTLDNPDQKVSTVAAYIPIVTYACDLGSSCHDKDTAAIIFTTVAGILGAFICFMGHRYFKTTNFVFGFLLFCLIFYQVICLKTNISETGVLALAILFGLIGGCLVLGLWWYCGVPVINVILTSLVGGYLISSILFYTPFGNLKYWESPFNYAATFICGILIVPVFLLIFTKVLHILTCAFVGSFGIIAALDVYVNGGMRYMVMNSLRHGTDPTYLKVIVTGPYTVTEIVLTCVWIAIFASGTAFQLFRERKKAPFPPCPRQERRRSAALRRLLPPEFASSTDEREPLIRGGNAVRREIPRQDVDRRRNTRQYGATTNGDQRDFTEDEKSHE